MNNIELSFDINKGFETYGAIQSVIDQVNVNFNSIDSCVYLDEASLGNLSTWNNLLDTSAGNLNKWAQVQDASIVLKAAKTYVDASISNTTHIYQGGLGGLKDASGNVGDFFYDVSTLYMKVSLGWIRWSDASIKSFG